MTTFPTSLDSLSSLDGTESMTTHSILHTSEREAINALEVKVGIDSSSDINSLDYKCNLDKAITINTSGNDVNFVVKGGTDNTLLNTDGSADTVGIGTQSTGGKFHVNGVDKTSIVVEGTGATSAQIQSFLTGEAAQRFQLLRNGEMQWGDGTSIDTNLYRSGANTLRTDDNLIVAAPGTSAGSVVTVDGTQTLTSKRVTQRVVTTTDDATAVIDVDVTDLYQLSAVANATVFTLTGTPTDGQKLTIRFKDAGVAKGLTWTGFTPIGVTLPTTTVASKWHMVGCIYNLSATQWQAVAVLLEA